MYNPLRQLWDGNHPLPLCGGASESATPHTAQAWVFQETISQPAPLPIAHSSFFCCFINLSDERIVTFAEAF